MISGAPAPSVACTVSLLQQSVSALLASYSSEGTDRKAQSFHPYQQHADSNKGCLQADIGRSMKQPNNFSYQLGTGTLIL